MQNIFLFFILTIATSKMVYGQNIPYNDSISHNVFLFQVDSSQGSAFVIELDKKEFVVTAKHLFKDPVNNSQKDILIIKEKTLYKTKATLYIHADTTIDIAVLKLPFPIKHSTPFVTGGQIKTGQDVYFLGYPSFNNTLFATQDTSFGILPLVKRAIVSGAKKINNYYLVFLDGHNNPGFSGGPIVFYDYFAQANRIMGVVSGYYHENKYTKNRGIYKEDYIEENSGIIVAYTIELVYQIAGQNLLVK